jgi:cytochrome c biogenesis protein CcmG/thiol:disulfide interchange protein DsbE
MRNKLKTMLLSVPFCIMLVVILLSVISVGNYTCAAAATIKSGDTPPALSLQNVKGGNITLPTDFKGKIIVIHFWASSCPYCLKEMEAIESLNNDYRAKGIAPFSINVGQTKEMADAYLAKVKITYPILLDPLSSAARIYGVSGIPMTFIIDRKGVVRYRIMGEINRKGLDKLLLSVMDR